MGVEQNKAAVERLWRAFGERQFERAGEELGDEFVCVWPHSGEVIRGPENFIRVNAEHPDPWISIEVKKIVAEGEIVVTEVELPVEGCEPAYAASFFELRDGKIVRLTEYWIEGRSQEPYDSRAGISERA